MQIKVLLKLLVLGGLSILMLTPAVTFSDIRPQLLEKRCVTNLKTGQLLSWDKNWVFTRNKNEQEWRKLIPGKCPQWNPNAESFIFFLEVGFDGYRSQIWNANANGEKLLRLTVTDFHFPQHPPAISPDGKKLACSYTECMATGNKNRVLVIELQQLDHPALVSTILRTGARVNHSSLQWKSNLAFSCTINNKTTTFQYDKNSSKAYMNY